MTAAPPAALMLALREAVQPDPLTQPLPAGSPTAPGVTSYRDIEFAAPEGYRPLALDVHRPEGSAPTGVLVFLHGGGWLRGSRRRIPIVAADVVAAGLALVCPDYRLSGEAPFPAQLDDVRAALAWLAARGTELGLETGRVVLWGESAGGHLAALAGLGMPASGGAPPPLPTVAGVIDWFGPSDLAAMGDPADPSSREARLLGGPLGERAAEATAASPVTQVRAGAPPFLLAHGDADTLVPITQSQALHSALTAAGCEAALVTVPGAQHGWFGVPDTAPLVAGALDFAARHLNPVTEASR